MNNFTYYGTRVVLSALIFLCTLILQGNTNSVKHVTSANNIVTEFSKSPGISTILPGDSGMYVFDSVFVNNMMHLPKSMYGFPPIWGLPVNTGDFHIIKVRFDANPSINEILISEGDYIGGFYTDGFGEKKCGGTYFWEDTTNLYFPLFKDDPGTTLKEGFNFGETIEFRIFHWETGKDYIIDVIEFDTQNYPSTNKWAPLGFSCLTKAKALETIDFYISASENPVCYPGQLSLSAEEFIGNGGPYTFNWTSDPSGFMSSLQNPPAFTPTETKTYYLTVTGGAASSSNQITIPVNYEPTVSVGAGGTICGNQTISLQGTAANYQSLFWSSSGDGTFSGQGELNGVYYPGPGDNGNITVTLSANPLEACSVVASDDVLVNVIHVPAVNLGEDISVCGSDQIILNSNAQYFTAISWTTSGSGTFGSPNSATTEYFPSLTDRTAGNIVTITVTCNPLSGCIGLASDEKKLTFISSGPTCNCPSSRTKCENQPIPTSGTASNYSSILWTTAGDGTFANPNVFNTNYYAGTNDKKNGQVALTLNAFPLSPCQTPATKVMMAYLSPLPKIYAGSNATISKEDPYYQIPDDSATMCTSFLWSTGGDGTFSSLTAHQPKYYPGTLDKSIGQVTLTITGYPISPCTTSVLDEMVLTISDSNPVDAGADQTICGIEPVELYATTVNPVSYVMWVTSGNGTFEDETSLATIYFPDALDYSNGTVTLTVEVMESANPGVIISDSLSVFLQKPPTAFAGDDVTICLTPSIPLAANATNYSSLQWTSSGNGTFSNPNSTSTNYSFCVGDIENGHVTLTFTAFPISPCVIAATDTKTVIMVKPPVINAGIDASVCQGQGFNLNGSATFYQTISWATTGDGTFSNPAILNPVYTPGVQDNNNGSVILTLTGTALTPCTQPTNDALLLTILKNPTADAGPSVQICSDQSSVPLSGVASNYSTVNWTTSGDGSFSNSANLLTSYFTGTNDKNSGSVTLTLTANPVSPCNISQNDALVISIQKAPEAYAGANDTIADENIDTYCLAGAYVNFASGSLWVTSGNGAFFDPTLVSTCYLRSAEDLAQGYVFLTLTASPITPCSVSYSDDMKLTFLKDCDDAVANAGIDKTLCVTDDVLLNGTTQYSGSSLWATSGDGSFDDASSLVAEYFPGNSDLSTGSVLLTLTAFSNQNCNDGKDTVQINLFQTPTVDAGANASICQPGTHQLLGTAQNSSAVLWSTSGNGTFSSVNSLTPVYTPGISDNNLGSVTLTITASAISPCSIGTSDFMVLTIQKPPTANAGADQIVCQNNSKTINGTAANYSSVQWTSSGSGTFSAATSLTTNYTPGSADITNGNVTLTLTAYPISPCTINAVDQMILAVRKLPTANAGADKTICQTETTQLTGTATNYQSVLWSTSGNGTFNPQNALNTVYSPGSTDIQNGTVTITLTANAVTPCTVPTTDQMVLTINRIPSVDAGSNGTICENTTHQLNGIAADYNTVSWTSSGNGSFSNPNSLNAIYTPGSIDKTSGSVTLTLTATPKNNCGTTVTDSKILTISKLPFVEAGNNGTICQTSSHQLSGTASNYETVYWSTSGNGLFGSTSSLNTSYTPGSAETELGTVTLTLTASPVNPCAVSGSDNLILTIIKTPVVNVGTDATICETSTHNIVASASNHNGFTWSTSGDGTFSGVSTLSPIYTPGSLDKSNGSVIITLTANPISPCSLPVSDDKTLIIIKSPVVNAGNDATVCQGSDHVLDGSASNYSSIQWTTNRNGTFSNAGTLNPVYTPGNLDINNGNATLTLTATPISPCTVNVADNLLLTIQKTPVANAGTDQTLCQPTTVTLTGASASNSLNLLWTTNGNGTFNNATIINPVYTFGTSDTDSVSLTLTAYPFQSCATSYSDIKRIIIQKTATANAGADITVCQYDNVPLEGIATNYTSIVWSTNRNGTFDNPNSLITTYYPGSSDVNVGIATITLKAFSITPCTGSVSDTRLLTIKKAPTANAGLDATICEGSYRQLSGSVTNQTSFFWSTTGDGTFSNSSSLTGRYYPGPGDISNGSVTLMLTANGNSPCAPAIDMMILNINRNATVYAGDDLTVCDDLLTVQLSGVATYYSNVLWTTGGDGTFSNAGTLTPGYFPGPGDKTTGFATLTLTANGLSPCVNKTDQVKISFRKAPVAIAGNDATINETSTQYHLIGASVANESSYQWLTSGEGSFSGSTANNTNYNIHPNDKNISPLTLTLIANPISPCSASDEDFMVLSFFATCQDAIAEAGNDATVCETEPVELNGAVQNSASVQWTTIQGDGTFGNSSSLSTVYYPGENDVIAGFVTLCLTAFASEGCSDGSDCVQINFSKSPVAEAGNDATVCQTGTHLLTGVASFYSSLSWSTNGDGTFSSTNSLTTSYTPGTTDITNEMATLTLTVGAQSPCEVPATDDLYLAIQKSPTAYAGADAAICQNKTLQLNGSASDYSAIEWLTSGDGTYLLISSLNPVYLPGNSDKTTGIVTLTLTASAVSPCEVSAIDDLLLTIQKLPTVSAGNDAVVCENEIINISGTATNYLSVLWSATGDGTFENSGELNTSYTPGALDLQNGSVKLYFTAYPLQPCLTYAIDDKTLSFAKPSTADAGADRTICESDHVLLEATAGNFSTILWATSGDGSFDDPAILNPYYFPGATDIAAGMVTLTLSTEGQAPCTPAVDNVTLTIQQLPSVNAGEETTICQSDVFAPQSEASNFDLVIWSTSGDGDFDDINQLHPVYSPGINDISNGNVTLTLYAAPMNPCSLPASDDMVLTIQSLPWVEAGPVPEICDTDVVALVADANNYHVVLWSTSGDGFFDDPEDMNTNYHPGSGDITATNVVLTLTASPVVPCSTGVSDMLTITIQPSPDAFAGNNKSVEVNNNVVLDEAWAVNAFSHVWTTNGTGTFENPTAVNTTYYPSAADYSNGSVFLTLSVSPFSPCQNGVSSVIEILFTEGCSNAVALAGSDATTCESAPVTLSGEAQEYESIEWTTSGDGTFENPLSLITHYFPGTNDILLGSAELCLTAFAYDECEDSTSCLDVTIFGPPDVLLTESHEICKTDIPVTLPATATGYSTLNWTTAGDGTFDNPLVLNPNYTPGEQDFATGMVLLTLTAEGLNGCGNDSETMMLTIVSMPEIDILISESTICHDDYFSFAGLVTGDNYTQVQWFTTNGGGFFDDEYSLQPIYYPSPVVDYSQGSVGLYVVASPLSPCSIGTSDNIELYFQPKPTVNAGDDATICQSGNLQLSATAENYSEIEWTTTGNGIFSLTSSLNTAYTPGSEDIINEMVTLTINAFPVSPCVFPAMDDLFVTIWLQPEVFAGDDVTIAKGDSYTLGDAYTKHSLANTWSTSGDGTFDDIFDVNTTYHPGEGDDTTGIVTLTLSADPIEPCTQSISDEMTMIIHSDCLNAIAEAGLDIQVCAGDDIFVNGSAFNYSGVLWETSGDGSFDVATNLSAQYFPGSLDFETGSVQLCFTALAFDACQDSTSCLTLSIFDEPFVDVPAETPMCRNQNSVTIAGLITGYSTLLWTSGGDGTFDDSGASNPNYYPGANDLLNGGTILNVIATGFNNCGSSSAFTALFFVSPPEINILPEVLPVCYDDIVDLAGLVTGENFSQIQWFTTNGGGYYDNDHAFQPVYYPSPIVDYPQECIELYVVAAAISPCTVSVSDAVNVCFQPHPGVDAGVGQTVQASAPVYLNDAQVQNAASVEWSTAGDGTFSSVTDLNAVYYAGVADTTNHLAVLTLSANPISPCTTVVTDEVWIEFYSGCNDATAFAGNDTTICLPGVANLNGTAANYAFVVWGTAGDGTFLDKTTLETQYFPGTQDEGLGSVTITLSAIAGGDCQDAFDQMVITLANSPEVYAGNDILLCKTEEFALLTGSAGYYDILLWTTSGNGTFDQANALNTKYYPSIDDKNSGHVTITLTASNDVCGSISDNVEIVIVDLPTANAGAAATICQSGIANLSGEATNYSSLLWTTSGNGTFSSTGSLTPVYTPGLNDITNGTVNLTITASAISPCTVSADDVMVLTIQKSPTANAGADATICQSGTANLSGEATNYSSLLWTTSGNGTFSSTGSLTPVYTPGLNDITNGTVNLTLTASAISPCTVSADDVMVLTIQKSPTANAGADATICQTGTKTLAGTATNYASVLWTTSGNGTFSSTSSLTPVYTPGASDIANGTINLTLTASAISPCTVSADDVMVLTIQKSPTANAGADATICQSGTANLSGEATNYSSLLWTTSGNGTFSSTGSLTPVYTPGLNDITNGTVNLTLTASAISPCTVSADDVMVLTIQKSPTANAGADATICQSGTANLSGEATNYSSLLWTTSGNGTFSSTGSLTPVYTPGSSDIANGTVNLTLTAASVSPCTVAASDFMILTVRKSPTANAGADATICQTGTKTLAGTATNYASVLWTTSGNGTFSSTGSLTTVYTPGSIDITNGTVNLTITAAAVSPCTVAASDFMILTVRKTPTANAGADATICQTGTHTLNASATNYSSVQWFTSGDGSFSSITSLTPVYTPGASDKTNGTVTLTLSAAAISPCVPVASDAMVLQIQKSPTAYAGNDATICQTGSHTLAGIASGYSAVVWSTAGDGTFSSTAILNPVYTPGTGDISAGNVKLTLTTSAVSPCAGNASDFMMLIIQKLPTANAGADTTICQSDTHTLSGTATNNTGVLWTTSGEGTFSPANTLNTVYHPNSDDIAAGMVTLTLTASAISPCVLSYADAMVLTIQKTSVVNAGADAVICDTETYLVSGTASYQSGFLWTTAGDGTFSSTAILNPVYTPGSQDVANGSVNLSLSAFAISPCEISASDILVLTIQKSPVAQAGGDATICETETFSVSGTASDYSSVLWTSGGDGTFSPAGSLTSVYTPGFADISNGTVTLTFTASAISPCSVAVSDFMVLSIQKSPVVFAGADDSILFGQSYLLSDATAEFAAQTLWQTAGTGTFDSANVVNTRYYPSEADNLAGSVTLSLSAHAINPCTQDGYDEMVLSFASNCFDAVANAGDDVAVCTPAIVNVSGSAENYTDVLWQTSGDGTFDNNTALNTHYHPGPIDYTQSNVTLTLTAFADEPCNDDSDEVVVNFISPASVNAGNDFMVCLPDATLLSGTAQNASGTLWKTYGDGTFGDSTALITTYYPGTNDLLAMSATICLVATGNEPCTMVEDCITIIYNRKPVPNAGEDVTVCENNILVNLSGSVSYASSFVWSTTGDGLILSPTSLTTKYKIGLNDIANGKVYLILSATNSNCGTQRDTMLINILPQAFAYAGEDATMCGNEFFVTGSALATNAASVLWETEGDGTFDNPYQVVTNYHPGISDNQTGIVNICLTAVGYGGCDNDTRCLTLSLIPSAYAYAGEDVGICDNQTVALNAVANSYESIVWMTTGDGTFDNAFILNPVYTPGSGDIASKQVNLYVLAGSSGECGNAVDTLSVSIENVPEAMAGTDLTLCEGENITLSGQALHYSTIEWLTSGDGTFSSINSLTPVYTPGATDVADGTVTLTLTATGNLPCAVSVSDLLNMVIQKVPEVNAGFDVTICNNESYQLEGFATAYANITWTTNGDGTFSSANSLNAVYVPGIEDTANGWAKITLEAVSASPCNLASSDFMYLVIDNLPEIVLDIEDTEAELLSNVFLVIGAVDGDEYQWYGPQGMIPGADGSVLDLINVGYSDEGYYYCIVSNSCGADTSKVIYLVVYESHYISFPTGWSGMSSYIDPRIHEVENLFEPVTSQLISLENFTGCYLPGILNTLVNYDPLDGYKAKFNEATIFEIRGSTNQIRTVSLQEGWNYLPVISTCPAKVTDIFGGNPKVQIIKEIAGMGLYWPAVGINSIGDMIPGRAYFIRVTESFNITYPECPPTKSSIITADVLKARNNGIWNEITYTPVTHVVAVDAGLYEILKPGDILGAFTPGGLCAGYLEMDGLGNGLSLFGDDPLTPETDGFAENDPITFRVYRPATGDEFGLNVTFDQAYSDNDGLYSANGLSAIMKSETSYLSVFEDYQSEIAVYPNPSTGKINISGLGENAGIEILNASGQLMNTFTRLNVGKTGGSVFSIDITAFAPGVVFVKIIEPEKVTIRKIILQ